MSTTKANFYYCKSRQVIEKNSSLKLFLNTVLVHIVLLVGHVVEVVGEAGAGKTQFGLQLSICAALSALEDDEIVLYISTNGEGINYNIILNRLFSLGKLCIIVYCTRISHFNDNLFYLLNFDCINLEFSLQ